ncbi:MAG: FkbM family methyltransferase [Myxococcales bacterium]|nr:MAG: FkbM family methyltransferase [Myxococcales bacterium]
MSDSHDLNDLAMYSFAHTILEKLSKSKQTSIGVFRYIWENPSNKGQRLYRLFLAMGWQMYKRTIARPFVVRLDNGQKFVVDPQSANSTGVIYTRIYEPQYIMFLREQLNQLSAGTIIDVGAHVGLFSLLLAHLCRDGIAFEPASDNFRFLERNLELNRLSSFHAVEAAVSDEGGEKVFEITGSFSGTNRMKDQAFSRDHAVHNTVTVKSLTLDDYVSTTPLSSPLRFVKIDTEGHEIQVLKGAVELLRSSPEAIALVENSDFAGINSFFTELDWRICTVDKQGNLVTAKEGVSQAYNLIACGPKHPLWTRLNSYTN